MAASLGVAWVGATVHTLTATPGTKYFSAPVMGFQPGLALGPWEANKQEMTIHLLRAQNLGFGCFPNLEKLHFQLQFLELHLQQFPGSQTDIIGLDPDPAQKSILCHRRQAHLKIWG